MASPPTASRESTAALPLTVGILTLNEAERLPRALASVSFAAEIIVVDAGSTDRTLEIAAAHGATVIANGVTRDFAQARNRVLAVAQHDWILFVDADEVVSPELQNAM